MPGRQHDCGILSTEGRGHQVETSVPQSHSNPPSVQPVGDHPEASLFAGHGQHGGGCPVPGKGGPGVVSVTSSSPDDLSPVGIARAGPVCLSSHGSTTSILHTGQEGSPRSRCGCLPTALGSGPPVRLPSTSTHSPSSGQANQGPRSIGADSPLLGGCSMVRGGSLSPGGRAQTPTTSPGSRAGGGHRPPSPQGERAPTDGMAHLRRRITDGGATEEVAAFIQGSVRKSTERTYGTAWRAWVRYCQERHLDSAELSVNKLLAYLWFLHTERKLAPNTIAVHKAAICTILQPGATVTAASHPLVSRFMKAAFLARPPANRQVRQTWDALQVLRHMSGLGEAKELSLPVLARKTLALIAMLSVRRISDLSLLDMSPQHLSISATRVVLQPKFGSKQERPGHSVPVITLYAVESDPCICPVAHIHEYLSRTEAIRHHSALFLGLTVPHAPASVACLRRWVVEMLTQAGVEGSAGSTRAAAASFALATRVPLSTILESGDWSTAKNVYQHYTRQLPPEILNRLAQPQNSVQASMLAFM